MELYTSRWANKELAHLDCQPVGISRGTPKFRTGYRYRLLRLLAPSREAFVLEGAEFVRAYRVGLEEIGLERIMAELERISLEAGGLPLVLLCYEKHPCDCHRGTLSAWLRERGVEIRELEPGMLPARQDAPQLSLF